MICPICKTDTLHPLEADGVELDFCTGCKGSWFDEGELAFYVENTTDIPDLEAALAAGKPTVSACPRCSTPLVEVRYLPDQDLLLDVCPQCRGIYLDKGEIPRLEQLAATLETNGKVARTMKALEAQGYVVLGGRGRRT